MAILYFNKDTLDSLIVYDHGLFFVFNYLVSPLSLVHIGQIALIYVKFPSLWPGDNCHKQIQTLYGF